MSSESDSPDRPDRENGDRRGGGQSAAPGQESFWEWQEFKRNVVRASEANPDGSLRGWRWFDTSDRVFRQLDGWVRRRLPESCNPFTQAGAVANFMFVVAVITGFVLLIWYSPSVHQAYDSVVAMAARPWTAELTRSLHRYSSDAFLLFVIFHALKIFFAGRFTGSRWLAWVTGLVGIGLVWFIGWTGYWLVWDDRGALIAAATARLVDVLPFFAEPLEASFLTDDGFNSVLFLIVFFLHMLLPIGFGIVVWLHVSRLSKPNFFTGRNFSFILLGSLVVVSLLFPVDTGSKADMLAIPDRVEGDYYYMLPLLVTERLQSGLVWLLCLGLFLAAASVPWVMSRRRGAQPVVDPIKCNGCTQCYLDCPYNAISMVPRTEGNPKKSGQVAEIDPSICVSCGICVGSCDPVAIDYPNLSAWSIRQRLDDWMDQEEWEMEGDYVAFVCGNSAGSSLTIDPVSGECEQMPGYRVLTLPCAGWVHPVLIERALKGGAAGVLVAGCQSDPDFRLGADWLGSRIEGERHPELRRDRLQQDRLLFLKMDKPEFKRFLREARRFRDRGADSPTGTVGSLFSSTATGLFLAVILGALTVWPSSAPLPLPDRESELVISFKKAGTPIFAEEDRGGQLAHMQRQEDQQRVQSRADVWVQVRVEDRVLLEESYRPSGIFRRGYSTGVEALSLEPGSHTLQVRFGSMVGGRLEWLSEQEREVRLDEGERVVLRFDDGYGFRWYERSSD